MLLFGLPRAGVYFGDYFCEMPILQESRTASREGKVCM